MRFSRFAAIAALLAMLVPAFAFAEPGMGWGASAGANANVNGSAGMSGKMARPHARTFSGTVTSVSGSTINFTAENGGSYSVDTTGVKLVRRFGASMSVGDVQTGDKVQVRGTASGSAITATMIRDMSMQAKNGTFMGTVKSLASDGSSFVLSSRGRGDQTVNVNSSTTFKKNDQTASFSDLAVGQTVRVSGVWDRTNSNVTATKVAIVIRMSGIRINGTLASIGGNSLTVNASNGTAYTVDISHARLVRKFGGKSSISEFKVGDSLQVSGKHQDGSTSVTASYVRDMSITSKTVKPSTGTSVQGSTNTSVGGTPNGQQ